MTAITSKPICHCTIIYSPIYWITLETIRLQYNNKFQSISWWLTEFLMLAPRSLLHWNLCCLDTRNFLQVSQVPCLSNDGKDLFWQMSAIVLWYLLIYDMDYTVWMHYLKCSLKWLSWISVGRFLIAIPTQVPENVIASVTLIALWLIHVNCINSTTSLTLKNVPSHPDGRFDSLWIARQMESFL